MLRKLRWRRLRGSSGHLEEGGGCDIKSAGEGQGQGYEYDRAYHLVGEGIEYDNLGRITNLPAEYAGEAN